MLQGHVAQSALLFSMNLENPSCKPETELKNGRKSLDYFYQVVMGMLFCDWSD